MLFSMTGFGIAKSPFRDKTMSVEIKSVNAKLIDVRIKSPFDLREKEIIMRKEIIDTVLRGKIDVSIELSSASSGQSGLLNEELLKAYANTIIPISDSLGLDSSQIIPSLLRIPEILTTGSLSLDQSEWEILESTLDAALDSFLEFRKNEGKAIEADLVASLSEIESSLDVIKVFESERIEKIRDRIQNSLEEFLPSESIDRERFEQELVYYIERLDFSEEKSRLLQHCKYFSEILQSDEISKGRTLQFICQEMGREINTLGAKSYHAEIQKKIIVMKDELEKIKEQTANIV